MKPKNHQRSAHPWKGLARAVRRYREKNATSRILNAALACEHSYLKKCHA